MLRASSSTGSSKSDQAKLCLNAAFLLFCFFSVFDEFNFYSYIFTYVSSLVGSDAPSLGSAALACAFLLRYQDSRKLSSLWASTIFAALAVWSKQVSFPIFLILPAWVLATQGIKASAYFCFTLLCSLLAVSAVFVAIFGFQDMIFGHQVVGNQIALNEHHQCVWIAPAHLAEPRTTLPLMKQEPWTQSYPSWILR